MMKGLGFVFRKNLETPVPPDGMMTTHDLDFATNHGSNDYSLQQKRV